MNEQLEMIEMIIDHKNRLFSLKEGSYYSHKKEDFLRVSYGKWAVNELLDYIYHRQPLDVIQAVEEFRQLMDDYVCLSKTETAADIFLSGFDVATLVLDELIMFGFYSYE